MSSTVPSFLSRRAAIAGVAGASIGTTLATSAAGQGKEKLGSGLFVNLSQMAIPADVDEVVTLGHSFAGTGGARYRVTRRSGATQFRTQVRDGRWFELAEPRPDITMFGALLHHEADDTAAWRDAIAFAIDRNVDLAMPAGNSRVTGLDIVVPSGRMLRICGAGKARSAIVPGNVNVNADAPLINVTSSDIDVFFKLADLAVVDPGRARRGIGLRIERCARFQLCNIMISGWKVGLDLLGALVFEATEVSIVDNDTGRRFGKSAAVAGVSLYPNLVTFEGGDIRGNRIGTIIEYGNQIVDSRIDIEANGVADEPASGAIIIEATMGAELASRDRRNEGPCQYAAVGCWFEQNKGHAFTARGAATANIVLDRCIFVANQEGRDIAIDGVGGISLTDTMCVSPNSIVTLGARMERVEGGLYAGTLRSTSTAVVHRTRVAALDRAGWMTSYRLWHRETANSDLAWFTDKDAANGSAKDSAAWKYGDGRVYFRHGAAAGRPSLTLAPDAIGFLSAEPKPRQRIERPRIPEGERANRLLLEQLLAALEALGLIELVGQKG